MSNEPFITREILHEIKLLYVREYQFSKKCYIVALIFGLPIGMICIFYSYAFYGMGIGRFIGIALFLLILSPLMWYRNWVTGKIKKEMQKYRKQIEVLKLPPLESADFIKPVFFPQEKKKIKIDDIILQLNEIEANIDDLNFQLKSKNDSSEPVESDKLKLRTMYEI